MQLQFSHRGRWETWRIEDGLIAFFYYRVTLLNCSTRGDTTCIRWEGLPLIYKSCTSIFTAIFPLYARGESWLMTSTAAPWRTFANGKKGNDLLWAAWADCVVGYFLIGELIYHKTTLSFMDGFNLTIKDGRWRRVEAETVSARKSRRRMPSLVR